MGVQGAALATILSQAISALWAVRFLCGKQTILRLKKENLRIQKKVLMPCIALGVSPFAMQSTESILVLCFNSSLLYHGGDLAVGAMTILSSIMQFAMLPLQGLTQGGQPIISYNYGANQPARIKKSFFLTNCCLLRLHDAHVVSDPFGSAAVVAIFTNDPALTQMSIWALRIYMAGILLMDYKLPASRHSLLLAIPRYLLSWQFIVRSSC